MPAAWVEVRVNVISMVRLVVGGCGGVFVHFVCNDGGDRIEGVAVEYECGR